MSLAVVTVSCCCDCRDALAAATDASVGQINEEQVNNMPLQSRDWTTLGLLAAGTVTVGGASNAEFNVMGVDFTQNDFRLDGIDDNVEVYGAATFREPAATTDIPRSCHHPMPFRTKLQTGNFDAEYGHSTGGIVNAAIKSGTNGLHGDLWEYVRNTVFNANDYFANQTDTPRPPLSPKPVRRNNRRTHLHPCKLYNGRNRTFLLF